MSAAAYPLTWPAGRPRSRHTREALFRDGNQGGKRVSLDLARDRLELQMSKLGARPRVEALWLNPAAAAAMPAPRPR
ncbi:MAG: hypothetical protein JWM75_1250 [Sphingomonas bacterium]|nr:hypothetical protein [Sphingomonas bacterium]